MILCLVLPLCVGALSAAITGDIRAEFAQLNKPPLTPPGSVFPIVWTLLYLLMGFASYLILISGRPKSAVRSALQAYALQLLVNFLWPIFFFRLQLYLFSFFWLIFLCLLIFLTLLRFYHTARPAAALLLPYLLWTLFAGYLNIGIFLLN